MIDRPAPRHIRYSKDNIGFHRQLPERAAMLDVHPPHHPAHTWRDFFIHIATIVVGLLIAIGLEQTVEALHRHHERADLRASLHRELEQMTFDSTNVMADEDAHAVWLSQIDAAIDSSIRTGNPLGELPPPPSGKSDNPENPFYLAAKSSGQLGLLSEEEIAGYGEIDTVVARSAADGAKLRSDFEELTIAEQKLRTPLGRASENPPSAVALAPLQECVMRLQLAALTQRQAAQTLRGAAQAMLNGERNLKRIEAAER